MKTLLRSFGLAMALTLAATTAAAQPQASPTATGDADPLEWMSVVLVVGESGPPVTSGAEDIPPAVRKALAEVRDFLPFKTYRLYDAALIAPPRTMNVSANAWLRGKGAEVLEALLRLPPGTRALDATQPFTINFTLREPVPDSAKSNFATRRTLMSTSVTMSLDETVVVGTSRLRGDTALIVLLTAVPARR